MYGDIVVPETKEFESNPLIIDKFYSLFSVTGFKIPKNRIKEDNLPLFVSISYDKKNLIKNANATDKEKQRGFEFYINKDGKGDLMKIKLNKLTILACSYLYLLILIHSVLQDKVNKVGYEFGAITGIVADSNSIWIATNEGFYNPTLANKLLLKGIFL